METWVKFSNLAWASITEEMEQANSEWQLTMKHFPAFVSRLRSGQWSWQINGNMIAGVEPSRLLAIEAADQVLDKLHQAELVECQRYYNSTVV